MRFLSIERRAEEDGLLFDQVSIRLFERHAKFHSLTLARVTDSTSPEARGVQSHEKPVGTVSDEKLRFGGATNEIRTRIPADLQLPLVFLDLDLDGASAAAGGELDAKCEQRQARQTSRAAGNPLAPVPIEMAFGIAADGVRHVRKRIPQR